MTESEWLASDDPAVMLAGLQGTGTPLWHSVASVTSGGIPKAVPASDRKLRLWVEACREASPGITGVVGERGWAWNLDTHLRGAVEEWSKPSITTMPYMATMNVRAALLRCICCNPCRPVVLPWRCRGCDIPCGPPTAGYYCVKCGEDEARCPWLAWNGGMVRRLAEAIYSDNDFTPGSLGVLADALEEAGCVGPHCPNSEAVPCDTSIIGLKCRICHGTGRAPHPLLTHLREPGPHVRGCWAVDLLTGRE